MCVFVSVMLSSQSDSLLNQKLNRIESLSTGLHHAQDSLQRELLYYKVKEDYYTEALSDQSARFGVIITIALGLTAFLSFAGFKKEVTRLKAESDKKIFELKSDVDASNRQLMVFEVDLRIALGNSYALIAAFEAEREHIIPAFQHYLNAAREHAYVTTCRTNLGHEENYKVCESNLSYALKYLQEISKKPAMKHKLRNIDKDLNETLTRLSNIMNDNIVNRTAEIRVLKKTFLESN